MAWNYRVVAEGGRFAIREVFYDDAGCIKGYTAEPVYPEGDSIEELIEDFERYRRALSEPVVDAAFLETRNSDGNAGTR